jgi:hypothetical protein
MERRQISHFIQKSFERARGIFVFRHVGRPGYAGILEFGHIVEVQIRRRAQNLPNGDDRYQKDGGDDNPGNGGGLGGRNRLEYRIGEQSCGVGSESSRAAVESCECSESGDCQEDIARRRRCGLGRFVLSFLAWRFRNQIDERAQNWQVGL